MCGGVYEENFTLERRLLVSIWRCGGKLYRSYTDGTVETVELRTETPDYCYPGSDPQV